MKPFSENNSVSNSGETEKREAYSVTNPDHKFFFCHFANKARHNAYIIINEVAEALGLEKRDENNLYNSEILRIDSIKNPEKFGHVIGLLKKHFRFMPYLVDKEHPGMALTYLKNMLIDLNCYRNFFSHYHYESKTPDFKMFRIGRPNVTDISLAYLLRMAVKDAKKRLVAFTDDDFKDIYTATYKKDGSIDKRNFYNLEENLNKRVAFFLSLFLEKNDGNELISKIEGMRGTGKKSYIANRESFLQFWCTPPKPQIESGDLGLEILNELNRIPAQLYQAINSDGKKKFEPDQNIQTEGITTVMRRYQNRFPYFAIRFFEETNYLPQLRFHDFLGQLCLQQYPKFLNGKEDQRRITKDINALGKLAAYQTGDNINPLWRTQEAVSERLYSNDEEIKKNALNNDLLTFAPQYRMTHYTIGIILQNIDKTEWPTWQKKTDEKGRPKLILKSSDYAKPPQGKLAHPVAVISAMELQNLFLYAWLYKQKKIQKSPEDFIRDYLEVIKQCIDETKNDTCEPVTTESYLKRSHEKCSVELQKNKLGKVRLLREKLLRDYNIKPSDLPDLVRECLLNYSYPHLEEKLMQKIENHIGMAQKWLDESKKLKKLEKGRKKGLTAGKIGTRLAHEFISYKTSTDKPNDQQYNILQEYIAYFGRNIKPLDNFLSELKISGTGNHLFIRNSLQEYETSFKEKINAKKRIKKDDITYGVKSFYEDYLGDKIKYLAATLQQLKENKLPSHEKVLLLNIYHIKEKIKEEWDYDGLHVRLPRGIFNTAIAEAVKDEIQPQKGRTANPSYVIGNKFVQSQKFYEFEREYMVREVQDNKQKKSGKKPPQEEYIGKVEGALNNIKNRTPKSEKHKILIKRLFEKVEKNEKEVRYFQNTDRILWEMVKEFYKSSIHNRITNKNEMEIKMESANLEKVGFNVNQTNNFLEEPVEMKQSAFGKTVKTYASIKDYGIFRRLLRDKRLDSLLNWFENPEDPNSASAIIDKSDLDYELTKYDSLRDDVIKTIFEFEKACGEHSRFSNIINQKIKTPQQIHFALLEEYSKIKNSDNFPIHTLFYFRSKFIHNEFPDSLEDEMKNYEPIMLIKQKGKPFITEIAAHVISLYQNLTQEINANLI